MIESFEKFMINLLNIEIKDSKSVDIENNTMTESLEEFYEKEYMLNIEIMGMRSVDLIHLSLVWFSPSIMT